MNTYEKVVVAGGIRKSEVIDLGKIELIDKTDLRVMNFNSLVLDSVKNEKLRNVKVSLYKGYVDFGNKKTDDTPKSDKDIYNANMNTHFIQTRNIEFDKLALDKLLQMTRGSLE